MWDPTGLGWALGQKLQWVIVDGAGLQYLIRKQGLRRDCDFRDTLLAMHPDFISSQDFLAALVARFNDIGPSSTNHIEDRVVTQYKLVSQPHSATEHPGLTFV